MNFKIKAIFFINIIVVVWILKVIFFDALNDNSGILIIGTLLFLLAFNFYAYLIYLAFVNLLKVSNGSIHKLLYLIVLLLPFFVIWRMTS